MYERNAIVLERYFYEIFSFKNKINLRDNYNNYCKLFECYGILCDAKEKEELCKNEFDIASKEISRFQKTQEKLYNKSAKYEYSRYIIFSNISELPEKIEKHLNKVDSDVQKNNDELRELGEKFVQAVITYNEKSENLKNATEARQKAQKEYDNAYSKAQDCYNGITSELLDNAKSFIDSDNKDNRKALQEIFEENGKNEKNKFDADIILNTINKSFEIYKIEMDIYLAGYDRLSKLFEEIENDTVKKEKHTKYYRDSKAKLDFLNAEKNYIVQFLDNERIGAIYDKKTHRKLMLEACKKFALDFIQIDKLYDIIIKEAAGRSTKKIYKENYNREYLIDLENASVEPSLDTGKMRQEAIAFVNLNYWRIDGIKNIYETFENVVKNIYERDLSEFIPEELKTQVDDNVEEIEEETDLQETDFNEIGLSVKKRAKHRLSYHSSKISLANAIYYSLQKVEFANNSSEEDSAEELQEENESYEVPENVQKILADAEKIEKEEVEEDDSQKMEVTEEKSKDNVFDLTKLDEIEDEKEENTEEEIDLELENDDEYVDDEEDEEDSILEIYFNDDKKEDEKENLLNDSGNKKVGLFKKLVGFNSKKKREA